MVTNGLVLSYFNKHTATLVTAALETSAVLLTYVVLLLAITLKRRDLLCIYIIAVVSFGPDFHFFREYSVVKDQL